MKEKVTFEKISFKGVKLLIKNILNVQNSSNFSLTHDSISTFAEKNGIIFNWKPIDNWDDFEYGNCDYSTSEFLRIAFESIPENSNIIIVTDECFDDSNEAYIINSNELTLFTEEYYPEKYNTDFAEPFDFIFIIPDRKIISIIHHEGVSTQYIGDNIL